MKLSLTLPAATSLALRKFASAEDMSLEDAGVRALSEFLTSIGHLEHHELDEDTETQGSA